MKRWWHQSAYRLSLMLLLSGVASLLGACFPTILSDDGDGISDERGDCDTLRGDVYPGAPELCDGVDNNCDDQDDYAHYDQDGDGILSCALVCDESSSDELVESCAKCADTGCQKDCNDGDFSQAPGLIEICDGKDNNCSGEVDENDVRNMDLPTWFLDFDQDGTGKKDSPIRGCILPQGYVDNDNDCDDGTADSSPYNVEICDDLDNDCDGEKNEGFDPDEPGNFVCVDNDGDGISEDDGDCNDTNDLIYPGAFEECDGVDNDCDGTKDVPGTLYKDSDNDGYGNPLDPIVDQCKLAPNTSFVSGDCDDKNTAVNPGAPEVCDSIDNDCDSLINEGVILTFYPDTDLDGFGTTDSSETGCTPSPGNIVTGGDCDDSNPAINPLALDLCNGIDDDCSGDVDEGFDTDGDGFKRDCGGDCDDTDGAIYPSAIEECNGYDDNCDTSIDEAPDSDGDGYTLCSGDCNDTNPAIRPGQNEPSTCNGIDDDCNGLADDKTRCYDDDGDGFTDDQGDCNDSDRFVYPGATEYADGVDDDCDGLVDGVTVHCPESTATTIQEAMDRCDKDTTVEICNDGSGGYTEELKREFDSVTLRAREGHDVVLKDSFFSVDTTDDTHIEGLHFVGGGMALHTRDAIVTIEACTFEQLTDSALQLYGGVVTILNSTFLNNGTGSYGAAIYANDVAYLRVEDSIFEGNIAEFSGGALYLTGTAGDIKDNSLTGSAPDGIRVQGGTISGSELTLDDNVITDTTGNGIEIYHTDSMPVLLKYNEVTYSTGVGLKVYGTAAVTGYSDDFEDNAVGGILASNGATLDMDGVHLNRNGGPGLNADGTGSVRLFDCQVKDNTNGSSSNYGAGIVIEAGGQAVHIEDCTFYDNFGGSAGALWLGGPASGSKVIGNAFKTNSGDYAGCMSVEGGSILIANNLFAFCESSGGGALVIEDGSATVLNNTLAGNETSATSGAITWLSNDPGILANNILYDTSGGYGLYLASQAVRPNPLGYNSLYTNSRGAYSSTRAVGTKDITDDPELLFIVNNIAGVYNLDDGSPCIDAGLDATPYGVLTDYYGTLRPSGAFDIGYHEFVE